MSNKENNVVNLSGVPVEDLGTEGMTKSDICNDLVSQIPSMKPTNLVVIGITEEGQFFIMDSETSFKNVSYMTDLAKGYISDKDNI